MQKEELFALLEQLYLDQEKYNKFKDYIIDFTSQPRCKKGCIEFLDEIFNLPQLAGKKELAIQLLSSKSYQNSMKLTDFIYQHEITMGYSEALKDARFLVLTKLAEYIIELSGRLNKTDLVDKVERQVYLRRAVARLKTIFTYRTQTTILPDQWHEVEPAQWTDYLINDLATLTGMISDEKSVKQWSDVYGDTYGLDNTLVIRSLVNYVTYLDSFLEY